MRSRSFVHLSAVAVAFITLVTLTGTSAAQAISSYRSLVPNGSVASCRTCHTNSLGGEGWNSFGEDVLRQDPDVSEDDLASGNQNVNYNGQSPDWSLNEFELCDLDSDEDGQTNGQELGDPECVWVSGAAPRTSDISNPGDPASTSANPDGVDGAEGEGEGEGGEGEGEGGEGEGEGGEGEGEGEGEEPGGCPGCTSTGDAALPIAGLFALLGLRRRRR